MPWRHSPTKIRSRGDQDGVPVRGGRKPSATPSHSPSRSPLLPDASPRGRGMPAQVLNPLRLSKGHSFDHVEELRWKGKPDVALFADAAAKSYQAVLTLLHSVDEARALKRLGLHLGPRAG